ncbi:MAG: hypothetical protein JSR80_03030 [Verrucomicrobia bacterium]|nr:hypothetical protein [Verrucomicrobiota bacterium]
MVAPISKSKVCVGVGIAGLAATAALAWTRKISRVGQLAIGGSSLACVGLGLISQGVRGKQPSRISIEGAQVEILNPQEGMSFCEAQFKITNKNQEPQIRTGQQMIKNYELDRAVQIRDRFNFVIKEAPKVGLDTAIMGLESYKKGKQGEFNYQFKDKKINLFDSVNLQKVVGGLGEQDKQVLANDIQTLIKHQMIGNGGLFAKKGENIVKLESKEIAKLAGLVQSVFPKDGGVYPKKTFEQMSEEGATNN